MSEEQPSFSWDETILIQYAASSGIGIDLLPKFYPSHANRIKELTRSIEHKIHGDGFSQLRTALGQWHDTRQSALKLKDGDPAYDAAMLRDLEHVVFDRYRWLYAVGRIVMDPEVLERMTEKEWHDSRFLSMLKKETPKGSDASMLDKVIPKGSDASSLCVYIQPGSASAKDVALLLHEISTLYRMIGGTGITFSQDLTWQPQYELVP